MSNDVALSYAKSLSEIEEISINDLYDLKNVIDSSSDLRNVLSNSSISMSKKIEILDDIFSGKINDKVLSFCKILVEKGRISELGEIIKLYELQMNKKNNIVQVSVSSAIELDEEYKRVILEKLEMKLQKKVMPKWEVLPEIIAGLIFKIGDVVIDSSLRYKIEKFGKIMK